MNKHLVFSPRKFELANTVYNHDKKKKLFMDNTNNLGVSNEIASQFEYLCVDQGPGYNLKWA